MTTKKFETTLFRDGSTCFIPVPFDPKAVFGLVRAPVVVTLNGYTYRSTIAAMGGPVCIPLRRSNREAAGLEGGETLTVTLELDTAPRVIEPPPDLVRALEAAPPAWERWGELSYSHQREHVEAVEQAVKPETRARRIEAAARDLAARPAKKARAAAKPRASAEAATKARAAARPATKPRVSAEPAAKARASAKQPGKARPAKVTAGTRKAPRPARP